LGLALPLQIGPISDYRLRKLIIHFDQSEIRIHPIDSDRQYLFIVSAIRPCVHDHQPDTGSEDLTLLDNVMEVIPEYCAISSYVF
jgi:hypothetical protein